MKKFTKLIFLFLMPFFVAAQGTLSGTILDEKYGDPLIGANVFIENTTIGTSTDFDGKYTFEVEPGIYNVIFSYVGYQDKKVEGVEIKDGEITYLDNTLSDEAVELDLQVVVQAKAIERSENALLMLQRKSEKIQDGISSQEMSRYAVGNVAAAMSKVTGATVQGGKYVYVRGLGDRYSISQLNGLNLPSIDPYRNSAQLDLIPTSLLDNIITAKTFTPDQPGTFTGGNLNIKTKSLPEQETFTISLSAGYNPQNNLIDNYQTYAGGNKDWLGYGLDARKRPSLLSDPSITPYLDKNAELLAFTGDEAAATAIDRVVNEFDFTFEPTRISTPVDHGISISYGNNYTLGSGKLGLILSGSYKRSFTHIEDAEKNRYFLFDINSDQLQNSGKYQNDRSSENPIVNGLAGLAYKFDDFNTIDFKLLYNHNTNKGVDYIFGEDGNNIEAPFFKIGRGLLYQEREMLNYQFTGTHVLHTLDDAKIEWAGSLVNATLDEPNLRFFTSQFNSERGTEGLPLSNVNDPFFFWRELQDDIINGKIDFTLPFGKSNKVKVGGFYSKKDRNFDEYRNIVFTPPSATRFDGNFDTFFADDNLGIINQETRDNGSTKYSIGNFINDSTRPDNSYFGNEEVFAAYAMLTYNLSERLKVVGGARVETTNIFVESKLETAPDSTRIGEIDKTNILPSLNLIYSLNEKMNLRASYSQTIARPNLREIAPFSSFDPLIDEFYIGNNNLTTTDIQNYDLRWEWFLNPGEIIAVSGFYKNFDNPIALQYLRSSNPEIQYTNVDNGWIYGLEFEFRKGLGFISDALTNLKLSTNFAIIASEMDVMDQTGLEPESRPFEGQAPFIGNVNLNYDDIDRNLDLTLAYNYTGDRLSLIGREGTPDIFDRARHSLDFTARKKFGKFGLSLSAKNLLNQRFVSSNEFKGQEFIFNSFRRGISFGLGLSYKIK